MIELVKMPSQVNKLLPIQLTEKEQLFERIRQQLAQPHLLEPPEFKDAAFLAEYLQWRNARYGEVLAKHGTCMEQNP